MEAQTSNLSAADKMKERMKRLKALHNMRNEARAQNHQEVRKKLILLLIILFFIK